MNLPVDTAFGIATEPASTAVGHRARPLESRATKALRLAATSWLATAVAGQLLFAYYVVVFYGGAVLRGRLQDWNRVLQAGYMRGDTLGNAVLAIHLALAVLIMTGGALQFVPAIRSRWPRFHRWNGRVFVLSAMIAALAGLEMIWTRKTPGDLPQNLASTLNVLLILGFATMAWRTALARRFDRHRRWALRLFLAASGVWFFRVGLLLWIVVNRGPVGFDPKTFTGPFLTFLAFAEYLLPLAVLQLWFHAQDHRGPRTDFATAGVLALCTLATLVGTAAAFAFLWRPHL